MLALVGFLSEPCDFAHVFLPVYSDFKAFIARVVSPVSSTFVAMKGLGSVVGVSDWAG